MSIKTKKPGLHAVVGLGLSGVSALRHLHALGVPVVAMDSRVTLPNIAVLQNEFPDVKFILGGFDPVWLDQAECMVLSPGLSPALMNRWEEKGIPLISDVELFAQAAAGKTIAAITGTNAKSTVAQLVANMAQQAGKKVALGGNFGVPALDLLQQCPDADLFVLELSSFQLETTYSLRPQAACILNITADHLDRHHEFHAYRMAKQRIYIGAEHAVACLEDRNTHCLSPVGHTTFFSTKVPAATDFGLRWHHGTCYLAEGETSLLAVDALPVVGLHYQQNALAALAMARALGIDRDACCTVLKTFTGLKHRCQWVREWQGVKWYNDSKGTNVGATVAALQGLASAVAGKVILIAGGVGKNADFSPLLPLVQQHVRVVILLGEVKHELHHLFENSVRTILVESMQQAVETATQHAQTGDAVLLSPACASFDMFKDYVHRGHVFMDLVKELA